ncbi:hypothetical protein QL285_033833 [Trifolium repens]|nr:hypothetical protein QL285_033833 [Trifolium repens]
MFPSISYEYTSKSQDTTLKTRSLSYHASFLEAPVEYHPIVVQCHHGNYHQNYFIPNKLSSLLEDFPTLPLSISPRLNEYAEPSAHIRIYFQSRLK